MENVKTQKKLSSVLLSSLAKVFPDKAPVFSPEETVITALHGETVSYQIAVFNGENYPIRGKVSVSVDVDKTKKAVRVRSVELVPSVYPCHVETDDDYLKKSPGIFPDLLRELDGVDNDRLLLVAGQWHSLWVDFEATENISAGDYNITVSLIGDDGDYKYDALISQTASVRVYSTVLPKQTTRHTEWFHTDCIADYYHVKSWSEEHWKYVEEFIKTAGKRGINMLLTPIHTPPLDTAIGGSRTTVQLVDIKKDGQSYCFNFDKVHRFIDLCQKYGVIYFEMSHLFTQWGAKSAPKIIATENGVEKQIFGWDSPAVGGEYTVFLRQYIKALMEKLTEWGVAENTYFHISDEPSIGDIDAYEAALNSVSDLLEGATLIDALSDYDFYKKGLVSKPIAANNHIMPFIDAEVPNMWTYYCTAQHVGVSNRFMAMPSSRNRVLGIQLYKYEIEGFLQWGYNFYNTQSSLKHINPYAVTDAGGVFPSGDAFLVYPGEDGIPEESIRLMVLYHAFCDVRALKLLESLSSREHVLALIQEGLSAPVTFTEYPHSDMYYIQLRNLVNWEIEKLKS